MVDFMKVPMDMQWLLELMAIRVKAIGMESSEFYQIIHMFIYVIIIILKQLIINYFQKLKSKKNKQVKVF